MKKNGVSLSEIVRKWERFGTSVRRLLQFPKNGPLRARARRSSDSRSRLTRRQRTIQGKHAGPHSRWADRPNTCGRPTLVDCKIGAQQPQLAVEQKTTLGGPSGEPSRLTRISPGIAVCPESHRARAGPALHLCSWGNTFPGKADSIGAGAGAHSSGRSSCWPRKCPPSQTAR